MSDQQLTSVEEQLISLFGSYKAEWLKEQIYELFTEPTYFPELRTARSCVLIGGRGTGKTTVLRGLSYRGQFALHKSNIASIKEWKQIGIYYRINTNHVTAFDGPELSEKQWTRLFAHYFNLLLCDLVLEFIEWYGRQTGTAITLPESVCTKFCASLHLKLATTLPQIRHLLENSLIEFEAYINNVVDDTSPKLSMQASPINILCSALLQSNELQGKQFAFLLDEYENLLDRQQRVVNTLIKHAETHYCFKIGVRDLGFRCRTTLNENEQLQHPADYARIHIAEKLQGDAFIHFALNVCSERIRRIQTPDNSPVPDLRVAFPELREDDEAALLGVSEHIEVATAHLKNVLSEKEWRHIRDMPPLECYFVKFWADSNKLPLETVAREAIKSPSTWATRYNNYKYSILFTLRRGKRGIRKYYAGWSTFTLLAAGNIRYVLSLVDQSLLLQFQESGTLSRPVSPALQTSAAQRVGASNLSELEGLSVKGAQLTKLVLSLGRTFQVMASELEGHAPEVNQFHVKRDLGIVATKVDLLSAEELLDAAVMHLALIRYPGNKPGDSGDTKDYDYMVHPIFCPLFEFSFRRKRKMILTPAELLGFVKRPKETIRQTLRRNHRSVPDHLPEQLGLFERFYDADT